jgi:hypothetical protein
LALGTATGFPNDPKKIGLERYYTETGLGIGGGGSFWIGAALADWFVFGLGFSGGGMGAGDYSVGGGAFIFHVDAFPAFGLGGRWRELGVTLETGAGGSTVTPKDDTDTKLVDSGGASSIGAGVFYDGLRLWKLSSGPFVMGTYLWSDSMRRGGAILGWRTALYTSP